MSGAERFNEGKPELSYIMTFPEAMRGLARVCEYGAKKYNSYNYLKGGVGSEQHLDCLFRHLLAWYEGEDHDPESGIHHLDHALFNMLRLNDEIHTGKCADNRPFVVLGTEGELDE